MTYEQVLCPNNTLLLNNSYLLQQFSLRTHEVTPFANKKNSMKAMLDQSGDLTLWYTGEEIVVFAFGSNTKVWRETVKCKKSKIRILPITASGCSLPGRAKRSTVSPRVSMCWSI